jgi:hypothetical protein
MEQEQSKPKIQLNVSTGFMIQFGVFIGAVLFFIFHNPQYIDTRNIPIREEINDEDAELRIKYLNNKKEKNKRVFEQALKQMDHKKERANPAVAWPLMMRCVAEFSWSEQHSKFFKPIDEDLQIFFWGRSAFVFTPKYGGRHEVFSKVFLQKPFLVLEKQLGWNFEAVLPQRKVILPSSKDFHELLFTRGRGVHILSRFADPTQVADEFRFIQNPIDGAKLHSGALLAMKWELRHQLQAHSKAPRGEEFFYKQCQLLVDQNSPA